MNYLFLINYLKSQSISPNQILVFSEYISRDGFNVLSEKEFNEIMDYFGQYPQDYEDIIPLMTDNNSNYICVYRKGKFKEAVCFLSHDEINLYPKFKNIASLISAINSNPSAWDFFDFPDSAFDYSERKIVE
jgi:hypothetical protein